MALLLIGTVLTVSCSGAASGDDGPPLPARPAVATSTTHPEPELPASSSVTATGSTSAPSTTATSVLDREAAGERMQRDLRSLVGLGVREAGSDAEAQASQFLLQSLRASGIGVEVREVPLPTGGTSLNLLARFGDGGTHVLFGAHYDSKPPSPGADDNGSGTVVLLELARRLVEAPPRSGRVTVAFFGAEEILVGYDGDSHHFGSRLLAAQMAEDGDLPDLMISADMVGVGEQIVAATYLDTDPGAAELIAQAAAELGLKVQVVRRGDISDHEAFARSGVPSAFLWRPDNPDYHRATDLVVRTEALLENLAILEAFLRLTVDS